MALFALAPSTVPHRIPIQYTQHIAPESLLHDSHGEKKLATLHNMPDVSNKENNASRTTDWHINKIRVKVNKLDSEGELGQNGREEKKKGILMMMRNATRTVTRTLHLLHYHDGESSKESKQQLLRNIAKAAKTNLKAIFFVKTNDKKPQSTLKIWSTTTLEAKTPIAASRAEDSPIAVSRMDEPPQQNATESQWSGVGDLRSTASCPDFTAGTSLLHDDIRRESTKRCSPRSSIVESDVMVEDSAGEATLETTFFRGGSVKREDSDVHENGDKPHTHEYIAVRLGGTKTSETSQEEHNFGAASISLRASRSTRASSSSSEIDSVAEVKAEMRALWGTLLDISKEDIKQLTSEFMNQSVEQICHMRIIGTGNNNRVFVVIYDDGTKICIRVPASGWGDKWTEHDRSALLQTVLTMKFLSKNTSMPIPHIHHYDLDGDDNAIHAPYIAMEFVDGAQPLDVWYGGSEVATGMFWFDPVKGEHSHEYSADCILEYQPISNELEKKRQTMLRSLACYVAELRKFSFEQLGAPTFSPDGHIEGVQSGFLGHFGMMPRSDIDPTLDAGFRRVPVHDNMQAYLEKELDEWYDAFRDIEEERLEEEGVTGRENRAVMQKNFGYFGFMQHVISCLPGYKPRYVHGDPSDNAILMDNGHESVLNETGVDANNIYIDHLEQKLGHNQMDGPQSEDIDSIRKGAGHPYVLALPDFGSQNLIADPETGEIKALIDWDGANTMPRYIGWSTAPDWLSEDFDGSEDHGYMTDARAMHADDHERYRADYARYLRDACEADGNAYMVDDWKYTSRSPLFKQIVTSVMTANTAEILRIADLILEGMFPRTNKDYLLQTLMILSSMPPGMERMVMGRLRRFLGLVADEDIRDVL